MTHDMTEVQKNMSSLCGTHDMRHVTVCECEFECTCDVCVCVCVRVCVNIYTYMLIIYTYMGTDMSSPYDIHYIRHVIVCMGVRECEACVFVCVSVSVCTYTHMYGYNTHTYICTH